MLGTTNQLTTERENKSNITAKHHQLLRVRRYRVPDDCIDSKRYPLFMAREVMAGLIEQLKASRSTAA